MPKILIVIPWSPLHPAGVSIVVRNLIENYESMGLQAQICQDNWSDRHPRIGEGDVLQFRFGILGGTTLLALLKSLLVAPWQLVRIATWLTKSGFTCINFHYVGLGALSLACLKTLGLFRGNLVLSFHGTDVQTPSSKIAYNLLKFTIRKADSITFCSQALQERALHIFGFRHSNSRTIYNGVDITVFRAGIAPNPTMPTYYIVQVGSFIPRKRQVFLTKVFLSIKESYPDLHLVLVGMDGPELCKVRALAEEHGCHKQVHTFVNLPPEHVAQIVSNAVVCVQPSSSEPFGISVIEAGACALPVVASRVEGHLETISHGNSGLLFDVDDHDACVFAIRRVLDEIQSATRMGRYLQARVCERFTWQHCAREYVRVCASTYMGT